MKKTLLFCGFLALASSLSAKSLTVIEGGRNYGGFMPECISPDGTYIGGSTFVEAAFMSEWQIQDTELSMRNGELVAGEVRSVNNSGIGVGYGGGFNVWNFVTGERYGLRAGQNEFGIRGGMADAISEDGRVITGVGMDEHFNAYAVYWEDGIMHVLPTPTDEELGFRTWGSRALFISQDASLIVGRMVDDLATYPMVMWWRQPDGSYICDPVCTKWYGNDNEFVWFQPMSLSPDGSKVAMRLMYNVPSTKDKKFSQFFIGIYDVAQGTLAVAEPDGEHGVAWGQKFDMFLHGISNDGTCVGWFYDDILDRHSFIMYPDEMQPMSFTLAFPELEEIAFYDVNGDLAPSGISADGRYICGMGWTNSKLIFDGFVLDTWDDAGVEEISLETERKNGMIYNFQGRRVKNPLKGEIYIIDGKKVVY